MVLIPIHIKVIIRIMLLIMEKKQRKETVNKKTIGCMFQLECSSLYVSRILRTLDNNPEMIEYIKAPFSFRNYSTHLFNLQGF